MAKNKKLLVCIVGPTAIGKTALAIYLAQKFNTEIISADSRQFFREISIGTAKPSPEELAQAPHHFINSHSIHDNYSVGDFEKEAITKIDHLFQHKDLVIMVGGSGLYVNAVLNGFDEIPRADDNLRQQLNDEFNSKGIKYLQEEVKKIDPEYFDKVDIHNPQRLIRAIEVYRSSGKTFTSFRKNIQTERNFESLIIGLNTNRDALYQRINNRVDQMITIGLVNEVKNMLPYQHINALKTVGYTEIFSFLNNNILLPKAVELIKQNTRRFAKRQLTWFRRQENTHWFLPNDYDSIEKLVFHQLNF